MIRIALSILSIFACWKWGEWKDWRVYYPTILYGIIGDLAYNFVFFNHTLWQYEKFINHTISDIFNAFLVFPWIIILVLSRWPQGLLKQSAYILAWAVGLSVLEYGSNLFGFFSYHNEWNIFWSFAVYVGAFILLRVHYKHPLVVWPISAALAIATAILFDLPFSVIK